MGNKFVKYLLLFLLLVCIHLSFNGLQLIAACLAAGALSFSWFRYDRFFLLSVLLLELLIGLGYWLILWRGDMQLQYLAMNSSVPASLLAVITIGVNAITVFLCISLPFSLLRAFRARASKP